MNVTALTLLILRFNSLIDTKKYDTITIDNIHAAIKKKNALRYLKEQCGNDIDLSLHLDSSTFDNFEEIYEEELLNTFEAYAGDERRKWGVQNSGISLILAWTNQIIQTGKFIKTDEPLTWDD